MSKWRNQPSPVQSSGASRMKLFISWSGEISHKIAVVLRDWIAAVIPSIAPWVSSEDIPKGTRWGPEVAKELADSFSGIICVIPDNIREPWLLFEAGALSRSVGESRVFPILFGVQPSQLPGPLAQFQATIFEKEDIGRLMRSLNEIFGQPSVPPEQLTRVFNHSWLSLQAQVAPLLKETPRRSITVATDAHAPNDVEILSKGHLAILKILSQAGADELNSGDFARMLRLTVQKVRYYLVTLREKKYIGVSMAGGRSTKYHLVKKGRAFLVEKGLL